MKTGANRNVWASSRGMNTQRGRLSPSGPNAEHWRRSRSTMGGKGAGFLDFLPVRSVIFPDDGFRRWKIER